MEKESFRKYLINKIASERIIVYRGIEGKFNLNFNTPQFFSVSKTIAQSYGENLYEFELQLNKPFELNNKEEQQKELMPIIEKVNKEYIEKREKYVEWIIEEIPKNFKDRYDIDTIEYYKTLLKESPKQFIHEMKYKRLNHSLETAIQIFENIVDKERLYLTYQQQNKYLNEIIDILKTKGYDSIIRTEESRDVSNEDKGVIIWNKNNIISYKKISSVEY